MSLEGGPQRSRLEPPVARTAGTGKQFWESVPAVSYSGSRINFLLSVYGLLFQCKPFVNVLHTVINIFVSMWFLDDMLSIISSAKKIVRKLSAQKICAKTFQALKNLSENFQRKNIVRKL
jgi:hypothetical protein